MVKQAFLLIILILFFGDCKEKKKEHDSQILGTRYSRSDQFIHARAGSLKKEDRVALVYALEEVTVQEKLEEGGKEYYKLTTVTGKQGYAPVGSFSEAVLFVVGDGIVAFRRPTLTAGTKGKLSPGAFCFIREIQGEWANADCMSAYLKDLTLEDWPDVWLQYADEKFSKNPLLGETVLLMREALKIMGKADKNPADRERFYNEAKEKLNKALEKQDALKDRVRLVMENFGFAVPVETPPVLEPPPVPESGNNEKN